MGVVGGSWAILAHMWDILAHLARVSCILHDLGVFRATSLVWACVGSVVIFNGLRSKGVTLQGKDFSSLFVTRGGI